MKKTLIACLAATIFLSGSTFANVIIQTKNVPNDAKLFIYSYQNGERIYANDLGGYATVADDALSNYAPGDKFGVGVDTGITVKYCNDISKNRQFLFNLSNVTSTAVEFQLKKKKCGHDFAYCKLIT